ncbi:hypothetical protein AeRB84_006882 [Aphanomyces euteiches]|nr:hypothetical protein AeRB84_006882 [Aphanomyces euteiches]
MRVFLLLFVAATAMALSHDQPIAQVASFEESQTLPATLSYGALDAPTQPSVKEGDITVKLRSLRGKGRGRGRGRRGSHRRHLTAIQTDEVRELSIVGGGFMGGVKSLGRKVHSTAGNIGRATGRLAGKGELAVLLVHSDVWLAKSAERAVELNVQPIELAAQPYLKYVDIKSDQSATDFRSEPVGETMIFYHKARIIDSFFDDNAIETLPHPPQSPDLNPIEHLWELIGRKLSKKPANSIQNLKTKIEAIWNQIPVEYVQKLIMTMPKRLDMVIANRGGHTKY